MLHTIFACCSAAASSLLGTVRSACSLLKLSRCSSSVPSVSVERIALPAMQLPSSNTPEGCRSASSAAFHFPTTGNSKFFFVCQRLHYPFCTVLPFSLLHPFGRAHGWRRGW